MSTGADDNTTQSIYTDSKLLKYFIIRAHQYMQEHCLSLRRLETSILNQMTCTCMYASKCVEFGSSIILQ